MCSIEAKEEIERRLRKETRLTVKKLARWAKKHVNGNGENNAPLAGEMKSWPKAEKLKIGTNSSLKENCAENEWKRRTSAIVLYRVSLIISLLQNQKTNFYRILVKILSISSCNNNNRRISCEISFVQNIFIHLFSFFFTSEESSPLSNAVYYREEQSRCKGASISARWQGARRDGARERHEEEIREPAKRKQRDVTRWGERGKRGAMAAALAYYARRERRRRMFLKHVRHALTTVHWPSYDVTTTLSPSLLLSCFFFPSLSLPPSICHGATPVPLGV